MRARETHSMSMPQLSHYNRLRRRVITPILLAGLGLLAQLSGCTTGKHSTADGAAPGTGGSQGDSAGNVLRYPLTTDPTTLDPATVEDGTTIDLLQQVYEGLVKWNEKNEIVPNIAEKWEQDTGGTVYTFHLKHGVKFHNGREVTAADFKFSMERACSPATASETAGAYLKDIVGASDVMNKKTAGTEVSGIKALDPYTLQITIDSFKPYWLGNMTYPCAFVACKEAIEKNKGKFDETTAIGTGPYMLKPEGFRRGYQVSLVANPDYHDGKPKLDGILRPIIKDGSTRLSKFEAGELDYTEVSPSDLDHINSDVKLKPTVQGFDRARVWYLSLNQAAPNSPFVKKEVRQAFAYAINREEIIKIGMHDQAGVLNGILPPGVLGYDANVKSLSFDPAKAKQLLEQAGYPNGKGFPAISYSFRNDKPEVQEAAEIIRNQLQKTLGINIQLRPMEWSTYLAERTKKTMPFAHGSWGADYLDPQNFLSTLLHTSHLVNGKEDHGENGVGYSNAEFDKLCDQADVEHDPQKRIAMYQRAEKIAIDDAPWIPLYTQKDVLLIQPRVKNLRNSLFGFLPHTTTSVSP